MDQQTVTGHAARRFRLGDRRYAKNELVTAPDGQFADLERIGLVGRGPAPGPVERPKPKAKPRVRDRKKPKGRGEAGLNPLRPQGR